MMELISVGASGVSFQVTAFIGGDRTLVKTDTRGPGMELSWWRAFVATAHKLEAWPSLAMEDPVTK